MKDAFSVAHSEEQKRQAKDIVRQIPKDLAGEMRALVKIEEGIHLGVNAKGDRLSAADRSVLERTRTELKQVYAVKYTRGNVIKLDSMLVEKGLDNFYIKKALLENEG